MMMDINIKVKFKEHHKIEIGKYKTNYWHDKVKLLHEQILCNDSAIKKPSSFHNKILSLDISPLTEPQKENFELLQSQSHQRDRKPKV